MYYSRYLVEVGGVIRFLFDYGGDRYDLVNGKAALLGVFAQLLAVYLVKSGEQLFDIIFLVVVGVKIVGVGVEISLKAIGAAPVAHVYGGYEVIVVFGVVYSLDKALARADTV